MLQRVAKGLRTTILAACALSASAASAQTAPSLDAVSSEASRYSILADALWAMGLDDVPERIDVARAAVAAHPDSAEAHLRLGLALRLETPEAVALIRREYDEALRLDPELLRVYALIGELLDTQNDAEGVERTYQAWLALAPNDPKAHLAHAVALARFDHLPEARAELERSLALGPTAAAYLSRSMATPDAPRDVVLADLDKALAIGGGEARVYRWRARMRWAWGQTDLALADVDKALTYAPDSYRLRQLRGEINADIGRYAVAIAEFDALIALKTGWPDVSNDRCWARARAGKALALALADCDAALGWDPDRPEALDSRGLVKLRLGDLKGAIADYDAALKGDPQISTAFFGRGVAKAWSHDQAASEADLDKARALEPGIDKRFAAFGVTP